MAKGTMKEHVSESEELSAPNHFGACLTPLDDWPRPCAAGDDISREIRAAKQRELSYTACGSAVDPPDDFVAPVSSGATSTKRSRKPAKHKTRQLATPMQINASSKRAMGSAASSVGRPACGSSSHKLWDTEASHDRALSPKRAGGHSASSANVSHASPVDYVYDINVRRRLREKIDYDRAKALHDATEKESQLRAANKWVYDKSASAVHSSAQGDHKQAWTDTEQHEGIDIADLATNTQPPLVANAKLTACAASAVSRCSGASARASRGAAKRCPTPVKSSIAPNVSEWRTQASPVHPLAGAAAVEWRRVEQHQPWREAKDVHDAIGDFELRMRL